jgi:hypothetical protein
MSFTFPAENESDFQGKVTSTHVLVLNYSYGVHPYISGTPCSTLKLQL